MKSTGIVRKVDELGRIVLPIEMRRTLGVANRDPVEMFIDGKNIILRKYAPGCVFCGNTKEIIEYAGKRVCRKCVSDIQFSAGVHYTPAVFVCKTEKTSAPSP